VISNPTPMGCGNCGGFHWRLFHDTAGIACMCDRCGVQSVITTEPSKIKVEWQEGETRGRLSYHPRSA
jgi:inosine-uridine nucleoside N-ribohydrolase